MSVVTESVCQDACSLKRKTKNLDNGYSGVYFIFFYVHEDSTLAVFIEHFFIPDTISFYPNISAKQVLSPFLYRQGAGSSDIQ